MIEFLSNLTFFLFANFLVCLMIPSSVLMLTLSRSLRFYALKHVRSTYTLARSVGLFA